MSEAEPNYQQSDYIQAYDYDIERYADEIGRNMAVAITETGQMLFLYKNHTYNQITFEDYYTLHWRNIKKLWELRSGNYSYLFELPTKIRDAWLNQSINKNVKENAINFKTQY